MCTWRKKENCFIQRKCFQNINIYQSMLPLSSGCPEQKCLCGHSKNTIQHKILFGSSCCLGLEQAQRSAGCVLWLQMVRPKRFPFVSMYKIICFEKILQIFPSRMYTLKEKKLVYTSLLNNISSAACSRQLHCHSKCSFPSHTGFSVSFCIFTSLVLEHLQTSIYTWHSHRAWLHFIFTFQK